MTARIFFQIWDKMTATAGGRLERKESFRTLPAHAVVGGLNHSYWQVQVNTCERYGKKLNHCVERTLK